MALSAGKQFIKRHVQNPNQYSDRFLKELGLKRSDVVYNSDGTLKLLTYDQVKEATASEVKRDAAVKSALAQFVDESILRPNPSQRPLWASDPHFMLVFHLKSFMFSFHKVYISRIMHEIEYGNYSNAANLMMYVPAFVAVGFSKELIKDIFDDEDDVDYKKNWGPMDYTLDAAHRSGMAGKFTMIPDMMKDHEFGGTGAGAFVGPAFDLGTWTRLPVPFR